MRLGRRTIFTLVPCAFLIFMTLFALLIQLRGFWENRQYFLVGMDLIILGATIWVALESLSALRSAWSDRQKASTA
jgi:carbon starvation protein